MSRKRRIIIQMSLLFLWNLVLIIAGFIGWYRSLQFQVLAESETTPIIVPITLPVTTIYVTGSVPASFEVIPGT